MNITAIPQHIIQRVNFNFKCFYKAEDLQFYLETLKQISIDAKVSVHAYALMSNHVQLLVTSNHTDSVQHMMAQLGQRYTWYFNRQYCRKGQLWRERIRPCLIDANNYLLACQRYIELSPVREGLVKHPAEYIWSSYSVNALGEPLDFLKPHPVYQALGLNKAQRVEAYRQMFCQDMDPCLVGKIDEHSSYGYCLGSMEFRRQIEVLLGRQTVPAGRGQAGGKLQLRSMPYQ